MTGELFSVWVGGVEVNDHLLNLDQAQRLKQAWVDDGYDDVVVDKYDRDCLDNCKAVTYYPITSDRIGFYSGYNYIATINK